MLDVESFLLGMAAGGGGGNPNTVEVYSGTTATVMSNVSDLDMLIADIAAGNATAMLSLPIMHDATAAGIVISGGLLFGAAFFSDPQDTEPVAGAAYFYISGRVTPIYGKIIYNGEWVDLGTTDCTLTIIRHPLP